MRETIFNQLTKAMLQPPQVNEDGRSFKTIEMRRDENPRDSQGAGHHEICYMTARQIKGRDGWLVEMHTDAVHFARPVSSEVAVRQRLAVREAGHVESLLGLARTFRRLQAGLKEDGFRPAPKLLMDEFVVPPREAQIYRPQFGAAA